MVAPTAAPRFSNTSTVSTSFRAASAADRSVHSSTTLVARGTSIEANVALWSGL